MTACGSNTTIQTTETASAETAAAGSASEESTQPASEAADTAQTEAPAAQSPSDAAGETLAETEESEPLVIEYPLFDEPTTFTIWTSNSPDLSERISDINEYLVFEELEKITNVRWDATLVSFSAADTLFPLMVASGEYADVVVRALDYYTSGIDQAIEEEFLIDLNDLIDENMPNLQSWFDTYPELRKQLSSTEGQIAAFPKLYLETSDVTEGGCIRADWLEQLGLDAPETYDELHNVLSAFQSELGASEPLVISMNTGVQSDLLNGYQIGAGYYQVDGEIRFGPMQPEFKEYLEMMNAWYQEGLLSPSFVSSQAEVLMDTASILNGETGVWYGTSVQSITNLLSMSADPDMRITGVTYVTKTEGETAHVGTTGQIFDSNLWSITTACESPEAICQYIDYIYGEDGILLANYGVEGETFVYDEDGAPKLTELVTNNPDLTYSLALNVYTCDRQTPIPFVIDEQKARNDYSKDQLSAVEVWSSACDGLYNLPKAGVTMTADETTEYNTIYSDIDTYMDETIAKFVVGDLPLDQFDSFVDTLIAMGIETCIAMEQTAYDRYLES